ncbi:hypothetical protein [Paraburkholderia nemoris]|uniref:hypothetical protein n=1 Tax=Paraburkholderia nemoris TaxID=2793076 RepID=UPI0038BCFD44
MSDPYQDWHEAGRHGTGSFDEAANAGYGHAYLAGQKFRDSYLTPPAPQTGASASYGSSAGRSQVQGFSGGGVSVGSLGIGGWIYVFVALSAGAAIPFYFFPQEITIAFCGVVALFGAMKVGDDLALGAGYRFLSRGAILALTGMCIYGVIKGDVLAERVSLMLLDGRYIILAGIGVALGCYVLLRDLFTHAFGLGTVVKVAVAGVVFAAGAYFGGGLPALTITVVR